MGLCGTAVRLSALGAHGPSRGQAWGIRLKRGPGCKSACRTSTAVGRLSPLPCPHPQRPMATNTWGEQQQVLCRNGRKHPGSAGPPCGCGPPDSGTGGTAWLAAAIPSPKADLLAAPPLPPQDGGTHPLPSRAPKMNGPRPTTRMKGVTASA